MPMDRPWFRIRWILETAYLLLLLACLGLAQALLAYRKESEFYLRRLLGSSVEWFNLLPAYCIPVIPTTLAVALALIGTLLLILWRRTELETETGHQAPLEVAPPAPLRLSRKMAGVLAAVLLPLSASALMWAIMRTASRPREPEEGLLAWLFLNTTGDGSAHGTGWLWIVAILLGAGAFGVLDLSRGRFPRIGGRLWEWVLVAFLTVACAGIYSIQLVDWRYSVVGDEYAFFFHSECLNQLDELPLFGEHGVYGTHPQLSLIYQMVLMRILGFTAFAWRFSSVLAATAVLPSLYLLVRLLLGQRAAVTAAILYLVSHYNFSFAHLPYNNNHAMFPVITAIALFLFARTQASLLSFFVCGLATGLGFYTFFSGRVGLGIIPGLWGCWYLRPRLREVAQALPSLLAILVGFILIALPIMRNPATTWKLMATQTAFAERVVGKSEEPVTILGFQVHPESLKRLEQNTVHALLAPLTYDGHRASGRHFVTGGLVDRATSAMAFLGLLQSLFWLYRRRWFSLLIGYGLALVAVGVASPTDYPLITRMLLMVPFTVIMASAGVEKVWVLSRSLIGVWGTRIALTMFLVTAACLNGYEVFIHFPTLPSNSGENLILSLLQDSSPKTQVVYALARKYPDDTIIKTITKIYGYTDRFNIVRYDPVSHAIVPPVQPPCLVAVYLNDEDWPAIQKDIEQGPPQLKTSLLLESFDGGIAVIEIGDTGWTPTPPRKALPRPTKEPPGS